MLAVVQAEPGRPPSFAEREMYEAIWQRHTNRAPYSDEQLPESVQVALEQAASFEFASFRMLTGRDLATVLDLAGKAGAELAADVQHQIELQSWIATDSNEDGVPAGALPSRPRHEPSPVRASDLIAAAPTVERPGRDYETIPQVAVIGTARDEPADWLRAGQALQRVLLTATAHGVSASFLYQMIELRDMRGDSAPAWPWHEIPQMIIRLGYGPHAVTTPRRPIDDVLTRSAEDLSAPPR